MASKRLGHIGKSKFLQLKSKQMIDDINYIDKIIPNDNLCEACINRSLYKYKQDYCLKKQ